MGDVHRDIRICRAEYVSETLGITNRNQAVSLTGANEHRNSTQQCTWLRREWHHRPEQHSAGERVLISQEKAGGDIRAVGMTNRNYSTPIKAIGHSGVANELTQLSRSQC